MANDNKKSPMFTFHTHKDYVQLKEGNEKLRERAKALEAQLEQVEALKSGKRESSISPAYPSLQKTKPGMTVAGVTYATAEDYECRNADKLTTYHVPSQKYYLGFSKTSGVFIKTETGTAIYRLCKNNEK